MSLGVLLDHPEWLGACVLLAASLAAAIAGAQLLARRRVRTLLGPFGSLRPGALRADWLLFAALLTLGVGLLGPRIGERTVLVSTRGADVVLLFDVSKSMDASDVAPSRMQRARAAAAELLERLEPEDRAALAAFAGRGVLLTPLTPDTAALREMLAALDTSLIRPGASDLDAGVTAAIEAFESASDRPRVLVVLSDGETADRDTSAAATLAVRSQVRVLTAAIGTEIGATVPGQAGELRDSTGHVVVSRRRIAPLESLAEQTGGVPYLANEWGELDLAALTREIGREARGLPGELIERRVAAPMVLPFAALAFALLCLEALPQTTLRRLSSRTRTLARSIGARAALPRAALLAALLVALGPTPGPARAERDASEVSPAAEQEVALLEQQIRGRSPSARELLSLGIARARADRWDEAENSFLAAAILGRDSEMAAIAYHDLGVSRLRSGELEAARDFFFDSLALRPGHPQTRFNLEWTIAALEVARPPDAAPAPTPPPLAPADPPKQEQEKEESEQSEPTPPDLPETQTPKPGPSSEPSGSRSMVPELTDSQRERWIERIEDDPSKALKSAARHEPPDGRRARRRDVPAW